MSAKRFAIYFAPNETSPWWTTWSEWLGRDAKSQRVFPPIAIEGIDPLNFESLIKDPCRYGLHATIKAPFKLNGETSIDELKSKLKSISVSKRSFVLDLGLERLKNFFALTPTGEAHQINQLADEVVRELDEFRQPLTESDIAKRRLSGLSAREDQMLLDWGYPYVLDCFRFHISLTGHLGFLDALSQKNVEHEILWRLERLSSTPFVIDSLCVFEEPEPGADFFLSERFYFQDL